jgi:hypothetical protein
MTAASPTFRARNIPELLDLVIRLYRRNFLTFIGIIALVQIPVALIQMLFQLLAFSNSFIENLQDPEFLATGRFEDILGPQFWIGGIGLLCFSFVGFILVQGLATAATTRAVTSNYLGQTVGIVEAYQQIGQVWFRLVLALFMATLLGIIFLLWGIVPCVGWLTGIGIFIFWMFVIVPMLAPIIVLEDQTVMGSMRRAWDLVRRRFWTVLGFVFVMFLLGQLLIAVPVTLVNAVLQLLVGNPLTGGAPGGLTIQTIVQSLLTLGLTLIYLPLQITAITLLYFDLRIRTEGVDLALAASDETMADVTAESIINQAPQPERGNLITWQEFGFFILISLLGGGGFFLFFGFFAFIGAAIAAMAAS